MINDKTRAIYAETIGNPAIDVLDIEAVAQIAHDNGLPLVIDNTFASHIYVVHLNMVLILLSIQLLNL